MRSSEFWLWMVVLMLSMTVFLGTLIMNKTIEEKIQIHFEEHISEALLVERKETNHPEDVIERQAAKIAELNDRLDKLREERLDTVRKEFENRFSDRLEDLKARLEDCEYKCQFCLEEETRE